MKLNLLCRRFRKLSLRRDERELDAAELAFFRAHLETCGECRAYEETSQCSLAMLRSATLEPEISPTFDDRVLRRLQVQTVRESLGYWSPALVGAGIACVAIFATLQIAATPVQMKQANYPGGEAKRSLDREHPLPSLILSEKPRLDR